MLRKSVTIIIALMFLLLTIGCGPSKEAYLAETSYYEALSNLLAQQNNNQVLLEIKAKDSSKDIVLSNVESITVYAPPTPQNGPLIPQYKHDDPAAKWVPVALGLGTAAISVGGMGYMVHELGKWATAGTTYNLTGQNASFRNNATNTNFNQSGGTTGNFGGDYTATPTVVEQPAPVIVPAAEPVVVNQPAPVVVQ